MSPRIICPHCHSSLDPQTLETAVSVEAQYRICPECDEPIVCCRERAAANAAPPTLGAESRVPHELCDCAC